jgi:hypothetical protein
MICSRQKEKDQTALKMHCTIRTIDMDHNICACMTKIINILMMHLSNCFIMLLAETVYYCGGSTKTTRTENEGLT